MNKRILLIALSLWNLIVFFMFGADKRRAVKDKWRISEKRLLVSSALFAGLGGYLGMKVFHHKTRHTWFRILLPLCSLITLAAIYCIFRYL